MNNIRSPKRGASYPQLVREAEAGKAVEDGDGGGRIIALGTPEQVAKAKGSPTAEYQAKILRAGSAAPPSGAPAPSRPVRRLPAGAAR